MALHCITQLRHTPETYCLLMIPAGPHLLLGRKEGLCGLHASDAHGSRPLRASCV